MDIKERDKGLGMAKKKKKKRKDEGHFSLRESKPYAGLILRLRAIAEKKKRYLNDWLMIELTVIADKEEKED